MKDAKSLLDWIASMNFAYYKCEVFPDYDPGCDYHYYLKGSLERFSSEDIVKIWENTKDDDLDDRWMGAIVDNIEYNKRH
jgi:hypothetical protein